MVIDEELVYVGSFNLDYRSKWFQLEVGMLLRDRAVAAELLRETRKEIAKAELAARGGKILVKYECPTLYRRLVAGVLGALNNL
jgi:phosphatidylserine/phosphatidylglycerophosphate/cardiolipin synthase-like enzyme